MRRCDIEYPSWASALRLCWVQNDLESIELNSSREHATALCVPFGLALAIVGMSLNYALDMWSMDQGRRPQGGCIRYSIMPARESNTPRQREKEAS